MQLHKINLAKIQVAILLPTLVLIHYHSIQNIAILQIITSIAVLTIIQLDLVRRQIIQTTAE